MLDHVMLMPLMDASWQVKFDRVEEDGFSRLEAFWILREIVFPIIIRLLTTLCVPFVLACGVFPILGYPLVVNSAVYRFAWLGCLGFSLLCFCVKWFHVWFTNLYNSIRDNRELIVIGRRVHNFGEVDSQHEVGPADVLDPHDADVVFRHRRVIPEDVLDPWDTDVVFRRRRIVPVDVLDPWDTDVVFRRRRVIPEDVLDPEDTDVILRNGRIIPEDVLDPWDTDVVFRRRRVIPENVLDPEDTDVILRNGRIIRL
jgi:hypothetical protein